MSMSDLLVSCINFTFSTVILFLMFAIISNFASSNCRQPCRYQLQDHKILVRKSIKLKYVWRSKQSNDLDLKLSSRSKPGLTGTSSVVKPDVTWFSRNSILLSASTSRTKALSQVRARSTKLFWAHVILQYHFAPIFHFTLRLHINRFPYSTLDKTSHHCQYNL